MGAPATTLDSKTFKVYGRSKTSRNGVIGADASNSSLGSSSGSSAAGGWDNDDVTGLPMPAAACRALTVGHVLQVGDEVVTVKAVDRDNNTISVFVRGDASSPGRDIYIPTEFSATLMDYQEPEGHARAPLSDGTFTEIKTDAALEGREAVLGVQAAFPFGAAGAGGPTNPFMPKRQMRQNKNSARQGGVASAPKPPAK